MRKATIDQTLSAGGAVDLDTVSGIDAAIDTALNVRDRGLFNKLLVMRREAMGATRGRPPVVPAARRSALLVQIERASAACRALIGQAGAAPVARLLASGGRRAAPAAKAEDAADRAARQGNLLGLGYAKVQ